MDKYKKLAADTLIFAVGSFGSKILMLLLTRLYTHNIASGDNSTKSLLEQTATFLIPIATLSIADAILRYGLDRDYDNKEVFTSACTVEACGLLLMILLSPLLNFLPYTDGYVILLVLYIMASAFRQLSSQFVRARNMLKLFALDGILATLSLFIFNVIFISVLQMGVLGFMLSAILSDFCSGVFLWIVAKLWQFLGRKYFNVEVIKTMLRFSVPMIPTAILWTITEFSDRLFVRYMTSAHSPDVGEVAAGVYDAASKVPHLISMVSTIFFQAWNMSAITASQSKDKSEFYAKIFSAYQSIIFLGAAFMIALVKPLCAILIDSSTDPSYARAFEFTPILIIGVLTMTLNQFLSSIYTATKKTTHSFWTSLVAAGSNLILNTILIYQWGVQGATIATFLSYFLCYLVRIVDTRKLIYFEVDHLHFACNLLVLFVMSVGSITEPFFLIPMQVGFLLFMTLFNFSDIMQTVQKLLKRG